MFPEELSVGDETEAGNVETCTWGAEDDDEDEDEDVDWSGGVGIDDEDEDVEVIEEEVGSGVLEWLLVLGRDIEGNITSSICEGMDIMESRVGKAVELDCALSSSTIL